jgi:hypothetical protein
LKISTSQTPLGPCQVVARAILFHGFSHDADRLLSLARI